MQCLKMISIKPRTKFKPLTAVQKKRLNGEAYIPVAHPTMLVPCGKCAFCLVNRRSNWMFRVYHEMRTQLVPGHFLTLTYSEKYVKRVDTVSGVRLSLRFRDVQLFLKRVRREKFYCKYICVGEYGGETKRPHYHMLLWTNCPAERLESFWQMGRIHFGKLTMASAMYTLKYIIQPKQEEVDGIEKTRAQFSKGLGLSYLTTAVYEWHTLSEEEPEVFSHVDGRRVALPRYYKNKIFTRWQMQQQNLKARMEAEKKLKEIESYCKRLGIDEWLVYYQTLRVEEAKQIISTTKFNQKL